MQIHPRNQINAYASVLSAAKKHTDIMALNILGNRLVIKHNQSMKSRTKEKLLKKRRQLMRYQRFLLNHLPSVQALWIMLMLSSC